MGKLWKYIEFVSLAYCAIYFVLTKLIDLNLSFIYEQLFIVTLSIVILNGVVKAIIYK